MLQYKAQNAVPRTAGDDKGPPSISVLLNGPQAIRTFQKGWTDGNVRSLPQGVPSERRSTVTRCITIGIPNAVADSTYSLHNWMYDAGAGYGTDLSEEFLLTTPWDMVYAYNNLDFYAEGSAIHSPGTTGYSSVTDTTNTHGWGIFYYSGRIFLRPRGEYKIRDMLCRAVELFNSTGIVTELEVGNELNLFAWATDAGGQSPPPPESAHYSYPPILGVPLMPSAYASLFHEICRIASESQYCVFPTPTGRIPILSGGFAQYTGFNGYVKAMTYRWGFLNTRNPFHPALADAAVAPDFPSAIRKPQEDPDRDPTNPIGPNPDRRYIWDWLDWYYQNVTTWDGGPAAYPGQYRGQGNGKRPSGVIDDLDGFGFHLYISAGADPPATGNIYKDDLGQDEVHRSDAGSAKDAFRRLANQFCRFVGVHGEGIPPEQLGFENNGSARYPAYYHNLACHATEFSFVGMNTRELVRDAYQAVVDYYGGLTQVYPHSTEWPWTRLRRLYHWADDARTLPDGRVVAWDDLCAIPGVESDSADGTLQASYYLAGTQQGLHPPGEYHRSLQFYNP